MAAHYRLVGTGGSRSSGGEKRGRLYVAAEDWLRDRAPAAGRLVSVCTGALLPAEAGRLDGRRATHWAVCDHLADAYPKVQVEPDPIFVRDGRLSTSAGVTAGIDLALALEGLERLGARPTGRRVVTDGKYVTAAGVSSGIDMGLTLVGRPAGDEHAQTVQLLTEYDPQPPYDAGSPLKAPAHLVGEFRSKSRFVLRQPGWSASGPVPPAPAGSGRP